MPSVLTLYGFFYGGRGEGGGLIRKEGLIKTFNLQTGASKKGGGLIRERGILARGAYQRGGDY